MNKRTMTLNLSDREMTALENLAESKGESKTTILRRALKTYKAFEDKFDAGYRLVIQEKRIQT